jgi:hypothetical protein
MTVILLVYIEIEIDWGLGPHHVPIGRLLHIHRLVQVRVYALVVFLGFLYAVVVFVGILA